MAYVYAIGDHLQKWIVNICLERCESNYMRLNSILNVLDLWDTQFIFQHSFIHRLKIFLMPQHDLAKKT